METVLEDVTNENLSCMTRFDGFQVLLYIVENLVLRVPREQNEAMGIGRTLQRFHFPFEIMKNSFMYNDRLMLTCLNLLTAGGAHTKETCEPVYVSL